MLALKQKYEKVIDFKVVTNKKKQPKLKKDGTKKYIPNNNSEERWVNPIRNKEVIMSIIEYLHNKQLSANRMDTLMAAYRNEMLFIIGINVGLRVSDLITLKWENVFEDDMKTFRDARAKIEKKTGKTKNICPNKPMRKIIRDYLDNTGIEPKKGEYIFVGSRKDKEGNFRPITDAAVEKTMKDIQREFGLGSLGTHSLRKTYAYHKYMMYVNFGDPLALVKVQKDLNHRNSSETARYLGITREEQIKSSMELGEYWTM